MVSIFFLDDFNAFLFSFVNNNNQAIKLKYDGNESAIYTSLKTSAIFGGGFDLYIANDSNANQNCYSNLGLTYHHPKYAYGSVEAESFLTGSYKFQITEIEIFFNSIFLKLINLFYLFKSFCNCIMLKVFKKF